MRATIAVIGAGIAGLSAAHALQRRGYRVKVLERASVVGGRMQTREAHGYRWDAGAQFMVEGEYVRMRALMRELGVPMSPRALTSLQATVLPGDRLWYSRLDSPWAFLRHPLVPFAQKLRTGLALALAYQTMRRHRIPPGLDRPETLAPVDDRSLRAWGDRAIGSQAVDYFLSLPTSTLFFWEAEQTPWWYTVRIAQQALRWKVVVPEGGMGSVPQALGQRLDVGLGHAVRRLEQTEDGTLCLGIESPEGLGEWQVDGVILATPAPHALEMMIHPEALLGAERASYLRSARYVSNLTTAIGYRRPVEGRAYGLGVPLALGHFLAAIGWEHMKGPERVPPGAGLAVVMPTDAYSRENWDREDASLGIDLAHEVDRYYPMASEALAFQHVHRWRHAIPLFPVGRIRELARALAQPAPAPVVACGDYWMGPCTEQALATGQRAADDLDAMLQARESGK